MEGGACNTFPPFARRTVTRGITNQGQLLPHETFQFVLRPGDDLRDGLAVAQAGEHLVVDRPVVDLHRDFRRRLGRRELGFCRWRRAQRIVEDGPFGGPTCSQILKSFSLA